MGVVYSLYNHTRKEYVSMSKYAVNDKNWIMSPLANLFTSIVHGSYWHEEDWHLLGDCGDEYLMKETYKDITKEMVESYNEWCDLYPETMEKIYTIEEYRQRNN